MLKFLSCKTAGQVAHHPASQTNKTDCIDPYVTHMDKKTLTHSQTNHTVRSADKFLLSADLATPAKSRSLEVV